MIYTFATLAFFLMGAAVLHPQGLVPEGNEMITTLSRMYTDTLGEWASVVFLIGAIAVLGSTLWAAVPSWARMYTNFLATSGCSTGRTRSPGCAGSASSPWRCRSSVGGALPVHPVAGADGADRRRDDRHLPASPSWSPSGTCGAPRPTRGCTAGAGSTRRSVVSSVAIGLLGVYTLLQVFGVTIG